MDPGYELDGRTLDRRILSELRRGVGGVAGSDLAERVGVSRAAIWTRIEALRGLGYDIEASPHQGYRLISVPDALHGDDLLAQLGGTRVIGRDVRVFEETTSTNDVVEKLARDGVGEGVVVFAEAQTRGRGRLGRTWVSPRGKGLWLSVLLRPVMASPAVTRLTIAAATALARAIEGMTGLEVEVKWPNDLMLRGRKVAGILLELQAEVDRVRHVIMGIGVDVNQTVEDFPQDLRGSATSLLLETGGVVSRAGLAVNLLRELDRDYARALTGEFEMLADEWEARCTTMGREVVIQAGRRRFQGRAESLDTDGALLVRTQHGHLERVIGGDVTVER